MTLSLVTYIANELRSRYKETWDRDWPEDNKYLAVLWFEAKEALDIPHRSCKYDKEVVCEYTLTTMRENHDFAGEQEPASRSTQP